MPTDLNEVPNAETREAMAEARQITARRRHRFENGQDLLTSLDVARREPKLSDEDRG